MAKEQIGFFNQMFPDKEYSPVYFNIAVLERYFKDPRYLVWYSDYRGSIALKDEYAPDDLDEYEDVRDFGLAYSRDDKCKRAVVAFAIDLKNMPVKVQGYWSSYLLDDQNKYFPNEGFVKNLILGEWVDTISIYDALLMELHYINEMCKAILGISMFRDEFVYNELSQNNRPIAYHNILLPTRENYFNFIITLEKITTGNINTDFFLCSAIGISKIEQTYMDESGKERQKGSATMLSDWIEKNLKSKFDLKKEIIIPLKKLIKLRQTPAHKLYANDYDESIWNDQNKLMHEIYSAIRCIRLQLANHPFAQCVEVDETLYRGEKIRIY